MTDMDSNISSLQDVSLSKNLAVRKKLTVMKKRLPGRTVRCDITRAVPSIRTVV
jgi:hypothetical protein